MTAPVTLFSADADSGQLILQQDVLQDLLHAPGFADKPVLPVCVTGTFRKGKSFLLNILLRYLQSYGSDNWLATDDTPLAGFPWRAGRHPETTGVQVWPQPLPVTLADGQPASVLLIDTMGANDGECPRRLSSAVAAAVGVLSAVRVHSVSRQLQADELAQLRLDAELGQLLAELADEPTAGRQQRLVLLVRDWPFPDAAPFGEDGGQKLLSQWLDKNRPQTELSAHGQAAGVLDEETQRTQNNAKTAESVPVKEDATVTQTTEAVGVEAGTAEVLALTTGFANIVEQLQCYLLPHPGSVAGRAHFTGASSQLAAEFRCQIAHLAPWLLDGGRARQVDGQPLTGAQLVQLCRRIGGVISSDKLPAPVHAANALVAAVSRRAEQAALADYQQRLEATIAGKEPLTDADLLAAHQVAEQAARLVFRASSIADADNAKESSNRWENAVRETFERNRALNQAARELRQMRAEHHNAALVRAAKELFKKKERKLLSSDEPSVDDETMRTLHTAIVQRALKHYDNGYDLFAPIEPQRSKLQLSLDSRLAGLLSANDERRSRQQAALEAAQTQYAEQMNSAPAGDEEALRGAHAAAAAVAHRTAGAQVHQQRELSASLAQQLERRLEQLWADQKQQLKQLEQATAAAVAAVADRDRNIDIIIGGLTVAKIPKKLFRW